MLPVLLESTTRQNDHHNLSYTFENSAPFSQQVVSYDFHFLHTSENSALPSGQGALADSSHSLRPAESARSVFVILPKIDVVGGMRS